MPLTPTQPIPLAPPPSQPEASASPLAGAPSRQPAQATGVTPSTPAGADDRLSLSATARKATDLSSGQPPSGLPMQQPASQKQGQAPEASPQPSLGKREKPNPFDLPPSVISPDSIRQNTLAERQSEIEKQIMDNVEKAMGNGPSLFPHAELDVDH